MTEVKKAYELLEESLARNDFGAAFELATKWAGLGHGWAELCLGTLFQTGLGVAKDVGQAEILLRRASEKGIPGAYYSIAVLFETEAPERCEEAQAYYQKAAELGYFPGQPLSETFIT